MRALPTVFAHIDADCFFASIELIERPHLKNHPVVVCTRNDERGIVTAANYPARHFGIRAGTPIYKLRELCPQAIRLEPHFPLYQKISQQMIKILQDFSPAVEQRSIDEAYLDLTGLCTMYRTNYRGIAERIQRRIIDELKITISVGIAPTKILAKIGSGFHKPSGITEIAAEHITEFLKEIAVKKIPGIGRNAQALFEKFNIATAYDFVHTVHLDGLLGKRGRELRSELLGQQIYSLETKIAPPKSLSNTRTFDDFTSNKDAIFDFSLSLLSALLRRLRRHGLEARLFSFFLMTKSFKVFHSRVQLSHHSDDDLLFIREFKKLFAQLFQPGIFRKSGFYLHDLRPKGAHQYSLFDENLRPTLGPALDKIQDSFGSDAISWGLPIFTFDRK
ncbi:hypothetical protein COV82_04235 [Candidatus Peregrinibacteria bacterium CG11_big_fil_rev_8_21_14_0_20_46_8]|nr:MAG: hypothetical protein COV82_04235 [Candidatus Peregrinibacteria bacterium CG11_big_fil_rev_8_21_14_0_20_46_8]